MRNVFDYITGSSYIKVNTDIVDALGLTEAYLLTFILNKKAYWEAQGKLSADGYFYATSADVQSAIKISEKVQRTALKNLKEAGIVDTQIRATDNIPKRYIKITAQAEAIISKKIGFSIALGDKTPAAKKLHKRKKAFGQTAESIRPKVGLHSAERLTI